MLGVSHVPHLLLEHETELCFSLQLKAVNRGSSSQPRLGDLFLELIPLSRGIRCSHRSVLSSLEDNAMWQNILAWVGVAWVVIPGLVLGVLYFRNREPAADKQNSP